MSSSGVITSEMGNILPTIVLISDMQDNDLKGEYEEARDCRQGNNWFKKANKIGIAVNGGNKKLIADFTRSEELVLELSNNSDIMKKVSRLLVTASMIGLQTHIPEDDKEIMFKKIVKATKEMEIDDPIDGSMMSPSIMESLIKTLDETSSMG